MPMTTVRQLPARVIAKRPEYLYHVEQDININHATGTTPEKIDVFRVRISSGFGSRHVHDNAPFDLWDPQTASFRRPTNSEVGWIRRNYSATHLYVEMPDMVVYTDHPPRHVPLTLASAPVRFAPSALHESTFGRHVGQTRPYAAARRPDLLSCTLPKYAFPRKSQQMEIIRLLGSEVDMRAVHFMPPVVIVEIDVRSDKTYEPFSLPSRAGGLLIIYHESEEMFFEDRMQLAWQQVAGPLNALFDDSNYLDGSPGTLCPGICLSSSDFHGPSSQETYRKSNAGINVQNDKGTCRRLLVSNHEFPDTEVFHPSPASGGNHIGTITERFEECGLAAVQLESSIRFTNDSYFASYPPKTLAHTDDVPCGTWFEFDGFSSGPAFMLARAVSHELNDNSEQGDCRIWSISSCFQYFGSLGIDIREGACGAPIVDNCGQVAGLFRWANSAGTFAWSAKLDPLIEAGWVLV